MSYVPAGLALLFGLVAVTACVRQREPPVPFIGVLALIVLVAVASLGLFVGFNPEP